MKRKLSEAGGIAESFEHEHGASYQRTVSQDSRVQW